MKYPPTAIADLEQIIDHCKPDSILCVEPNTNNETSIADTYGRQREQILKPCSVNHYTDELSLADSAFLQRYDLAVVVATLENTDKTQAQQLISRLRDLCTPKFAILLNLSKSPWDTSDLLAFGLVRVNHYKLSDETSEEESEFGLYQYNIDSYKNTPDWLNAKYWSNPKMWDKAFW